MSKSKGNVVDPLELMDTYGADALRFTLAALAAQGRDVKLSTARIEGYRNFITKLWNAARFCDMNECRPDPAFDPAACRETVNRWMVGEVARTAAQVTDALEAFRFNDAANILYHTVLHIFCDWYVEFIKPQLQDAQGSAAQAETRAAAAWVLDRLLVLLHPFTPFVTEALWQRVGQGRDQADAMLVVAPWVVPDAIPQDRAADAEMDWLVRLIGAIRSVRAEMGVPAAAKIVLRLKDAGAETRARLDRHRDLICRLARLSEAAPTDDAWAPDGSVQVVLDEATLILPLADVIDLSQERARLARELDKLTKDIAQIDARLGNPGFVAKAPEDVIDEHRERKEEAERARAKLGEALSRLQGAV
jgi:valyl-tRNA synthetase